MPPKVLRACGVLYILASTWASCHSRMDFVDVSTSKGAPRALCFLRFSNVLPATVACTFSTSQLPKAVRTRGLFVIFTSNVLRATMACNFSSLTRPDGSAPAALASRLPEPQNIGKKRSVSRLFYLFTHLHLLSSDSFSSLTLPTSAFQSVHIVGSLTSKLHSIKETLKVKR